MGLISFLALVVIVVFAFKVFKEIIHSETVFDKNKKGGGNDVKILKEKVDKLEKEVELLKKEIERSKII